MTDETTGERGDNSSIAPDHWGPAQVFGVLVGVAMILALENDWLSFERYVALMLFFILTEVVLID